MARAFRMASEKIVGHYPGVGGVCAYVCECVCILYGWSAEGVCVYVCVYACVYECMGLGDWSWVEC